MTSYDIDWLENIFISYGYGEWFEENRLEFLMKFDPVRESEAEVIEETLMMAREGEITFDTHNQFWESTITVFSQMIKDRAEDYQEETKYQ